MYIYIYIVFSLNTRLHTESWSKWDSSPRPRAYRAHSLTTAIVIIYIYYIEIYLYVLYTYHHPSLSTLRPKGLSRSMMKW